MNVTILTQQRGESGIRIGASQCTDAAAAARELAALLAPTPGGLSLVFASRRFDPAELGRGLREAFGATPLIGCTTAGEIGPAGYQTGSLAGVSFAPGEIDFEIGVLDDVAHADARQMAKFAHDLRSRLQSRHPGIGNEACFAFMLIDGLCTREESVARAFHDGLGGIALSGGSAGDDLHFADTRVIAHGQFLANTAILLVATTGRPFSVFKTHHFRPTDTRLVVTGAIPEQRIVTEINGFPAAPEYAQELGIDPQGLTPQTFAAHPVVVRIGNTDFVRSIQRALPDGSLQFFCAIDRGIVFKVAQGEDLLANLEAALGEARAKVGELELVLGCDCVLRLLECHERGLTDAVGERLAQSRVIGFSTFGEQYHGMHINQTFTGIAFGRRRGP